MENWWQQFTTSWRVSLIQVFILAWETEEGGGVVRLGGVSGANADIKVMKILSIL